MDAIMRARAADLRKMTSAAAADWLLLHYPAGGEAIILLEHVSLRRSDYLRLAEHYLAGRTHAHARAYWLFAHRLGLGGLIGVLGKTHNRDSRDADLLAYHLRPMLSDAKNPEELRDAASFVDGLASL